LRIKIPRFIVPKFNGLFLIFILFTLLTVLILISPLLVPKDTLNDLSGRVGFIDNSDQYDDLSIIPRAIYLFGDIECHQIASRSYFLNENQLPICSRDVGILLGISIGASVVAYRRTVITPFLLILGLIPVGLDGGFQSLTSYESTNTVRLITGAIAGVTISLLFSWVYHEVNRVENGVRYPEKPEK